MANFSERLKQLRAETGEKQSDVANVIGVSVQSFSSYEMGREPKYEVLCKLTVHFGCTTDYLLGLSDYRNYHEFQRAQNIEDEFLKCLDALNPEERGSLLVRLGEAIESSVNKGSPRTRRSIILRLSNLISRYGDLVQQSFDMKFDTEERQHHYMVFLRNYEMCMRILQDHKEELITSTLHWPDNEKEREEMYKLIYGEYNPPEQHKED